MITNNQVKFVQSLRQKKYRGIHGLFIAEGSKLVLDLINSPYRLKEVFAYEQWVSDHRSILGAAQIPFTAVNEKEMTRISEFSTPSPVLAIVNIPGNTELPASVKDELVLMLDDIRDPGNLGTIVRIADWFGVRTIIGSENMVDLYNPKVVQATMGSIARVNVFYTNLVRFMNRMEGSPDVFGTFISGENIYTCNLPPEGVIVIGSEANGISEELSGFVKTRLRIPPFADNIEESAPESLNAAVATAIICSEFRRNGTR